MIGIGRHRRLVQPFSAAEAAAMLGVNGIWLRARDHALGDFGVGTPWVVNSGVADTFQASTVAYYPRALDDADGYRAINFDGVLTATLGENLVAASAASRYGWAHQPTGGVLGAVVFSFGAPGVGVGAQPIFENSSGFRGIRLWIDTSDQLYFDVHSEGALMVGTRTDALARDVRHLAVFWWSVTAGYFLRVDGNSIGAMSPNYNAASANGLLSAVPNAGNPVTKLGIATFGAGTVGGVSLNGNLYELFLASSIPSLRDLQRLETSLAQEYDITLTGEVTPTGFSDYGPPRLVLA